MSARAHTHVPIHIHDVAIVFVCLYFSLYINFLLLLSFGCWLYWFELCAVICVHCHLNLLPLESWFDSLSIEEKTIHAWWSTAITMILYTRCMCEYVFATRYRFQRWRNKNICKWHLICTNVIEFLCYHTFINLHDYENKCIINS